MWPMERRRLSDSLAAMYDTGGFQRNQRTDTCIHLNFIRHENCKISGITQDRIILGTPETSGTRWVSIHAGVNVDTGLMDGAGEWNTLQAERVLICLGKKHCVALFTYCFNNNLSWHEFHKFVQNLSIVLEGTTFNLIRDLEILRKRPGRTLNISSSI